MHQLWNSIGLQDTHAAGALIANSFAESHLHVDAVEECAAVKPTAAEGEQLFHLAECES